MRSFRPEQLLLLLAFVLVPLFNLLVRWLRHRAAQSRPPADPRPVEAAAREEPLPDPLPRRARVTVPVLPRADARWAPPEAPSRRVLSRRRPLGGRAAVRRAVIAMTILGPCRGMEEPSRAPAPAAQPAARGR